MDKFSVTVTYIATFHYVIEAEDYKSAEDIGQEISLDEPAHDYNLYDVESRQLGDDDTQVVDNWED